MNRTLITVAVAAGLLAGQAFAETDPAHEIDQQWIANADSPQQVHGQMTGMHVPMGSMQGHDLATCKTMMREYVHQMMAVNTSEPGTENDDHE